MFEEINKRFDKHIRIVRELYEEPLRSTGENVIRDSGGHDRGAKQRIASQY